MVVLLGLVVAASFGSADFFGGLGSRRASSIAVLWWSQLAAVAIVAVVALSVAGPVSPRSLVFGAGAGLLNALGLGCLYRGLAIGRIGQVAPVVALLAAIIPVGWGLVSGERPGPVALVGAGIAAVAGVLVSIDPDERTGRFVGTPLVLALCAGTGFGVSFTLYAHASHGSGFWPTLASTGAAVIGVTVVVLVTRTPLRLPPPSRLPAIGAGVLEATAALILLVTVRRGMEAVVAPVVSLAPGFTVLHAWWYLKERLSLLQTAGLTMALVGMLLIGIG